MSKGEPRNGFRIRATIHLLAKFKDTLVPQASDEIVLESWDGKNWIDTDDMDAVDSETGMIVIADAEEISTAITRMVYAGIELAIDYIGEHDDLPVLLTDLSQKETRDLLINAVAAKHSTT